MTNDERRRTADELWETALGEGSARSSELWGTTLRPETTPKVPTKPMTSGPPVEGMEDAEAEVEEVPDEAEPDEIQPDEIGEEDVGGPPSALEALRRALYRVERAAREAAVLAEDLAVEAVGERGTPPPAVADLADTLEQDVADRLATARRLLRRNRYGEAVGELRDAGRAAGDTVAFVGDVVEDLRDTAEVRPEGLRRMGDAVAELSRAFEGDLGRLVALLTRPSA